MRKARRDQPTGPARGSKGSNQKGSAKQGRASKQVGSAKQAASAPGEETWLRIVGGTLRGRKFLYSGDERTRPMKNRVREAVFNLLGDDVVDAHAIDLFAGAGALGLEAISRGCLGATFIERHFPTAALVRKNAALLDLADITQVHAADTLLWVKQLLAGRLNTSPETELPLSRRWIVFCSPPFAMYTDRPAELLAMLGSLVATARAGSVFVVESDLQFDPAHLPEAGDWFLRDYPPARIAIYRKPASSAAPAAPPIEPAICSNIRFGIGGGIRRGCAPDRSSRRVYHQRRLRDPRAAGVS